MNPAHIHLLLNHLPVIGTIFGAIILISGVLLKQPIIKRTALGVFILAALFSLPSFLSGEGAEDVAEQVAGVDTAFIETHEDLASFYVWVMGGLGILSLVTFWVDWRRKAGSYYLYLVVVITSLVAIGISARVSNSGGEIRHTEIRKDAVMTTTPASNGMEEEED